MKTIDAFGKIPLLRVGGAAVELEVHRAVAPADHHRRLVGERDAGWVVVRGLGPDRGRGAGTGGAGGGAAEAELIERIGDGATRQGAEAGERHHHRGRGHAAAGAGHSSSSIVMPPENTWPPLVIDG